MWSVPNAPLTAPPTKMHLWTAGVKRITFALRKTLHPWLAPVSSIILLGAVILAAPSVPPQLARLLPLMSHCSQPSTPSSVFLSVGQAAGNWWAGFVSFLFSFSPSCTLSDSRRRNRIFILRPVLSALSPELHPEGTLCSSGNLVLVSLGLWASGIFQESPQETTRKVWLLMFFTSVFLCPPYSHLGASWGGNLILWSPWCSLWQDHRLPRGTWSPTSMRPPSSWTGAGLWTRGAGRTSPSTSSARSAAGAAGRASPAVTTCASCRGRAGSPTPRSPWWTCWHTPTTPSRSTPSTASRSSARWPGSSLLSASPPTRLVSLCLPPLLCLRVLLGWVLWFPALMVRIYCAGVCSVLTWILLSLWGHTDRHTTFQEVNICLLQQPAVFYALYTVYTLFIGYNRSP